ncbi:MAG TPA: hypothetical protein VFQ27_08385 [Xanthobacteraceae bacterium]|nr:hypothetical protein [Xanthobacteraceae bacterium]
MPRIVIAIGAILAACGAAAGQPCGEEWPDAAAVETSGYTLKFRTRPAKIRIGQHFAIEMLVCPREGAALPRTVGVDAFMPEHRHGMNYRPVVKALGPGRFQADGLMLHMPGRWEFRFDVERQGRTERLTRDVVLK